MGFLTHRYKVQDGEVKVEVFDSEAIPDGWHEDPGTAFTFVKAKETQPLKEETPPKKQAKQAKRNDNS